MNLNASNLQFSTVKGLAVPAEGPRAVPLTLDFSAAAQYTLNLQNTQARDYISMVQAVYLDNSANASPLTVTFPASGQSITIAPNRQGYFSVLCPNPAQLVFSSAGTVLCTAILLNFPVTDADWATQ